MSSPQRGTAVQSGGFRVHPVSFLQPSLHTVQGGPLRDHDAPDPALWVGEARNSATRVIVQSQTPEACAADLSPWNTDPRYGRYLHDATTAAGPFTQIHMAPEATCIPLRPSPTFDCLRGLASAAQEWTDVRNCRSQLWSGETDPGRTSMNPHLCSRLRVQRYQNDLS